MKVRIEHASNPLNYGTNMMVINFMYYLDKEMKSKNTYLLDVINDTDLNNYKKQYQDGNIKKHFIDYDFTYANSFIDRLINKLKRDIFNEVATDRLLTKVKSEIDKLIILGGDDLSEYYSIDLLKKEFNRLDSIKKESQIILVGQTIGPFYEDRVDLAKKCLKGIDIYSRDPWTTRYLQDGLGLNEVYNSADLAFLPLPNQDNKSIEEAILNKYSLEKDKYITLVPSGLYKSYCSDKSKYVENWVNIIKYIRSKYKENKIVLLPHVLRSDNDDRVIIKEIEKILSKDEKIVYIYDEVQPLNARFILGNGLLTITGRMHGAISTLQMRKPAISISYSVKYNGVIGEGLGLKNFIVKGDSTELWIDNTVSNSVIDKIDYVTNNYELVLKHINTNLKNTEQKSLKMIKNIAENFLV